MATFYETLGVGRDATQAEIRRAYRKQALLNHPDKNPDDREAAEARFVRVAQAYEVLGNEASRAHYDCGGLHDGSGSTAMERGFDFARASDLFERNFGEALMRRWQPGMRVSGTLVSGGRKISVTISPDGEVEENDAAAGSGNYRSVHTTLPGGGTMHTVHFEGGFGQNLAQMVVPDVIQRVPVVGAAVTTGVSWLPTIICGACCLKLCGFCPR